MDGLSLDTAVSLISGDLDGEEPFGSLEELESHVIGNLLPDDEEELLAGVVDDFDCLLPPSNGEELEDVDLFISGGGMELEGDAQDALGVYVNSHRTLEVLTGCSTTQHGSNGPGSVAGEHPYGEHPSRTLFVRNINSNVEDTELRALFEVHLEYSGTCVLRSRLKGGTTYPGIATCHSLSDCCSMCDVVHLGT